ncbi:MAG: helix-turn-helix transcriptional regulator [Magnetococcales bacterium]|nr:helix-turn-helix transcriptional regulator [Magnetococcales bacterium]
MSQTLHITIEGVEYIAIPQPIHRPADDIGADARDVAHYDRIRELLASGEEELMPAAFADRILDGESPLRVWREFRGLTLQTLADRVGVSKGYLSEIENGLKDGSVRVMKRVAEALGVTLDDIV